jgi:hypothetical protein
VTTTRSPSDEGSDRVSSGAPSVDPAGMDDGDDSAIELAPGQRGWMKLMEVAGWMGDLNAPLTAERAFLEEIGEPERG